MTGLERTLSRRMVFLLPTREGGAFAAIVLVILLGAINYGNGLAYAISFLLAAMAAVSAVGAQRNLLGLACTEAQPRPDFAGQAVGFRLLLAAPRGSTCQAIRVEIVGGERVTLNLGAGEQRLVELPKKAPERGLVVAPVVRISSLYPFGLLRAFSAKLALQHPAIAYPRPAPRAELPAGTHPRTAADAEARLIGGSGDFADLATYRVGENPHHIHWKAAAAGRGLLVKRFAGQSDLEVWITPRGTGGLEERLSRASRQVIEAERGGFRYGLRLGDERLAPGRGVAHYERCLRALALYTEHG
ncbi:MAG: DUF58 domain-containing protein [Gammaproteobacteria bacterium]|nr:DUF58 domain-containing protein [Gammaproteobacteria bacterium]